MMAIVPMEKNALELQQEKNKWTFSAWVKRSKLGSLQVYFMVTTKMMVQVTNYLQLDLTILQTDYFGKIETQVGRTQIPTLM